MVNSKETLHAMEIVLHSLRNIGSRLSEAWQELKSIEEELCDLAHDKELSLMSASEMVRHYLKERDALQRRRVIKDEIAVLDHFKKFQDCHDLLKFDVASTVAAMNKQLEQHRTRRYVPRIRNDLKICKGVS